MEEGWIEVMIVEWEQRADSKADMRIVRMEGTDLLIAQKVTLLYTFEK